LDAILEAGGASTFFHESAEKVTRCHTLAECFSHLTGGRLGFRMLPGDAARRIAEFAGRMTIISLNPEQTLSLP
jgi:hypothetical protein